MGDVVDHPAVNDLRSIRSITTPVIEGLASKFAAAAPAERVQAVAALLTNQAQQAALEARCAARMASKLPVFAQFHGSLAVMLLDEVEGLLAQLRVDLKEALSPEPPAGGECA